MTPTLKVSQRTCAASDEDLVTNVGDSNMKPVRLEQFSRLGYTVVRTTNESDSDRLLSFDDDPGFDMETLHHVIHREDDWTFPSNTA